MFCFCFFPWGSSDLQKLFTSPWLKKYLIQQTFYRRLFLYCGPCIYMLTTVDCTTWACFTMNVMWFGNREQMYLSYMPNVSSSHCGIFGEPDMPLMCFLSLCAPTKGEKTQFLSLPLVPLKSTRFLNFKMSISYFFFPYAALIYCCLLHVFFSLCIPPQLCQSSPKLTLTCFYCIKIMERFI